MQIIFAAPFLLPAAISFTVLAAFGRLRRFAVTIPTGIIASAPGGFAGLIAVTVLAEKFTHSARPYDTSKAFAYAVPIGTFGFCGLATAVVAALVMRWILKFAHGWCIRVIVFGGAFCSYCILLAVVSGLLDFALSDYRPPNWLLVITSLIVSFSAAALISAKSEMFRIKKAEEIPHEFVK